MNDNNQNNTPEGGQPQNPQQPFDYQAHYRQQNQQNQQNQQYQQYQQYYNPQQPNGPQGYQPPQPPIPPVPPTPQPPQLYTRYGTADNTKAFCILSYISILWLIGLLADRYNPKVRFHVNQGIILTIFNIAVSIVISIVKSFITAIFSGFFNGIFVVSPLGVTINGLLSLAGWGLFVAFMIIGIMHAAQDREEPLPIIGTLFQILK